MAAPLPPLVFAPRPLTLYRTVDDEIGASTAARDNLAQIKQNCKLPEYGSEFVCCFPFNRSFCPCGLKKDLDGERKVQYCGKYSTCIGCCGILPCICGCGIFRKSCYCDQKSLECRQKNKDVAKENSNREKRIEKRETKAEKNAMLRQEKATAARSGAPARDAYGEGLACANCLSCAECLSALGSLS